MSTGMWGVKTVTVMPGMFKKLHITQVCPPRKIDTWQGQQFCETTKISFRLRLSPKVFFAKFMLRQKMPRFSLLPGQSFTVRDSGIGNVLVMTTHDYAEIQLHTFFWDVARKSLNSSWKIGYTLPARSQRCALDFIPVPGIWLLDSAHYLPYHPGCRFTWPVRDVAALCWPGAMKKLYENLWAKRFALCTLSSFSFLFVEVCPPQILNTLSK